MIPRKLPTTLAALALAGLTSFPAAGATVGYWRAETDLNGGAGLTTPNEFAGSDLTASAASIDSSVPVAFIPKTGQANVGSINGDADINGTAAQYAALDSPSITIEMWARSNEGTATLFERTNGSSAGVRIDDPNSVGFTYHVDNGAGGSTAVSINTSVDLDANWDHLAFTYDAATGTGRVFANGVQVGVNDGPDARALIWTGAGDARVGLGMDGGSPFSGNADGFVDEVRISDRALQSYELLAAPPLAVDFQSAGAGVEAYHAEFSSASAGLPGPITQVFNSPLGIGEQVSVTVDTESGSGNVDFRDRGETTGALANLIEDQIKVQNEGIRLTLDGLKSGVYELTSYHHDLSGVDGGAGDNEFDILVTDALGVSRLVADNLAVSTGSALTAPTYFIYADGINAIEILFDNTGIGGNNPNEIPLNGFRLVAVVPTPAALPAGLALLTLAAARRRRR